MKKVFLVKNPKAKKQYDLRKRIRLVGLCIMGFALLLLLLGVFSSWRAKKKEILFSTLMEQGGGNRIVYLNVEKDAEPVEVMKDKKGKKVYCVVRDSDAVLETQRNKVICLSEKQLKKLSKKIKDSKDSVKIFGASTFIDNNDVKAGIAKTMQGLLPSEDINQGNIYRFVGAYYIDYFSSDNLFIILLFEKRGFIVWTVIFLVIGLVVFLTGRKMLEGFVKVKGNTNFGLGALDTEMNQLDAFWFDGLNTYATKNHVIGLGKGMRAVKYANILWIYTKPKVLLDTQLYQDVHVVDTSGKDIVLSRKWGNRVNGQILRDLQSVGDSIKKHNPDIAVGYSSEVQNEMRPKIEALTGGKKK